MYLWCLIIHAAQNEELKKERDLTKQSLIYRESMSPRSFKDSVIRQLSIYYEVEL